MTKKISKSLLAICLAFSFIFLAATPAKAAKVGDTKTEYKILTLKEVDKLCKNFQNAMNFEDGSYAVSVVNDIIGLPVISNIYAGAFMAIKSDIQRDYNFYDSIRSNMIQKGYTKVKIAYVSEYVRWKVMDYVDFTWKYKSKSVFSYYKS